MRGSGPRRIERSGPSIRTAPPKSAFPFPPEFRQVRGATPDEIGFTLADFAKQVPADQEIVEIGVFRGRTAILMAWGAKQGNGAHVTATFGLHDGFDPRRWNAETQRGFRDETLDPITLRWHGRLHGRYGLRVGDVARGEQHQRDRDMQMAAKAARMM